MPEFIANILKGVKQWVNGKISEVNTDIAGKQDILTPGDNIEITSGGTISVTGITSATEKQLEEITYVTSLHLNSLTRRVTSLESDKQDVLTAGANIEIDSAGTISVTGITEPVVSDFDIKDLSDSTGLRAEWSGKQDALTAGDNIEIDSAGTISVTGITTPELVVSKTYSQLVTMKNNATLEPGVWYRMTDFVTTVNSARTEIQSAGHAFDLLLLATTTNSFSAKVKAVLHDGDTYFAKSRLDKWEIWYDINNNTSQYDWASSNGKGVIYRMIDEWDNDHGFDFKNIQFKRYKLKATKHTVTIDNVEYLIIKYDSDNNTYWLKDSSDIYVATYDSSNGYYEFKVNGVSKTFETTDIVDTSLSAGDDNVNYPFADLYLGITDKMYPYGYAIDDNDSKFFYQYTMLQGGILVVDNSLGLDVSVFYPGLNIITPVVNNNKSANIYDVDDVQAILSGQAGMQVIDNNVFVSYFYSETDLTNLYVRGNIFGVDCVNNTFLNLTIYNTFGNYCDSNTFGNSCYSNTFGDYCYSNTFGNYCNSNTFGNSCDSNTFGNSCYSNTFGDDCYSNTFGNYCYSNTFGNYCYSNTFGNSCDSNTFGNSCYSNTFGDDCYSNTFGNYCYSNTFGNYCYSNTFGNSCYSNTFGNYCGANTFGNYCGANTFGNDYIHYCEFKDHIQYCLISGYTTSASSYLQHITVLSGTHGSSGNELTLSGLVVDASYPQVCGFNSSGSYTHKNILD